MVRAMNFVRRKVNVVFIDFGEKSCSFSKRKIFDHKLYECWIWSHSALWYYDSRIQITEVKKIKWGTECWTNLVENMGSFWEEREVVAKAVIKYCSWRKYIFLEHCDVRVANYELPAAQHMCELFEILPAWGKNTWLTTSELRRVPPRWLLAPMWPVSDRTGRRYMKSNPACRLPSHT